MPEKTKNTGELHGFYHHLGTLVIEGRNCLNHDKEEKDWFSVLAKSGFPKLADTYENLLLTRESDELYRNGLVSLIAATGEELRTSIRQIRSEDEIAYGSDYIPCEKLPDKFVLSDQHMQDISYLSHLISVGSLLQKRAAAEALGNFVLRKKDPANKNMLEEAAKILIENRDPETAFEVTHALSFAPGSEGKRAKATLARTGRFLARLHKNVVSYWDGLLEAEPVVNLQSADIVNLGIWMRLASDFVVGHVGEILIDLLARGDDNKITSLIAAFIYSADRRLLPVLIRTLQDGTLASKIEAIKAIAHITDPRSAGALEKAFRHCSDKLEKIVIVRALARMGSKQHAGYLVAVLENEKNPEIIEEALKAAGEMEKEDGKLRELVASRLNSPDPIVMRAAMGALAGIGDEGDITTLSNIAEEKPKMRAVVKTATQTLYSHIILRGSEITERDERLEPEWKEKKKKTGLRARMAAGIYYFFAFILLLFWQSGKSLKYIERSLKRNPYDPRNYFFKAYIFFTIGKLEIAIEIYRQAVSIDSSYTWQRPDDADRLVRAYLKRSKQIDTDNDRPHEALLLLGELDDIDLRRADPNLKIEIGRRIDYLRYTRIKEFEGAEVS